VREEQKVKEMYPQKRLPGAKSRKNQKQEEKHKEK